MKAKFWPDDNEAYYLYILCYVDDILVIHNDASPVLDKIDKFMKLKEGSAGDPKTYMDAKMKKIQMVHDMWCWSMSQSKYVQEAVMNYQKHLKENYSAEYELTTHAPNPSRLGYEPEMDVSSKLPPEQASYFLISIDVMRWMVELGRVDIDVEVSMLSSFLLMPRKGNMNAALDSMSYLKVKHNSCLIIDPTYDDIDYSELNDIGNWTDFHGDIEEAKPGNEPTPCGNKIELGIFVDSDLVGDKTNRYSRTNFMIFF